jgi:hypothetical protein
VTQLSLLFVAIALGALALFVWRASPRTQTKKLFALQTVFTCLWVLGVAGLQGGTHLDVWARFTFGVASLIPPCSLAFIQAYPVTAAALPEGVLRATFVSGLGFAVIAVSTDLIVHGTRISHGVQGNLGRCFRCS